VVELQLKMAVAQARWTMGGGELEVWGAPQECGHPFIGSGGRRRWPG
jgi:hypothetical protein